MRYKFFHILAMSPDHAEAELNHFCTEHHVLQTEREFVADGSNSYWAICVMYSDNSGSLAASKDARKNRVDYKETLNAADFAIFSTLRDLRKQIADREGTPVHNVFTNDQLAEMVQQRITSKTALGTISGLGAAKLEKYADEFLAVLTGQFAAKAVAILPVDEA